MVKRQNHPVVRRGGGFVFDTLWSNAKAARIGFLTGRGYPAPAIAESLMDGTSPASIRCQWKRWGLDVGRGAAPVLIMLTLKQRSQLFALSRKIGITPEEWATRVVAAAIKDDMYNAIVDDGE